jgi:hypothetical protein
MPKKVPRPRAALLLAGLLALPPCTGGPGALAAQSPHTTHTLRLDSGQVSPPAAIEAFAFLEGSWQGEGMGGQVDELWSAPAAGTMAGTFRLVRDGQVVFYEFLALEEDGGTVVFRLKHFDPGPGLRGWEATDRETLFRLVRVGPHVAWFHGLTLRLNDPNTLTIHLALRRDGELHEEAFRFQRTSTPDPGGSR